MERVDFTNDVEDTRYKINKWIENETHGECGACLSARLSVIREYRELPVLKLGVFCTYEKLLLLTRSNACCHLKLLQFLSREFPGGTMVKNSPANAGDTG